MTRFVVDAPVAIQLATATPPVSTRHALLAPTLMRSEVLALVYRSVREGERDERAAKALLDDIRALRIRLLGDRSLQSTAWRVAAALDWDDTFRAEYIALTQLQGDALVTLDPTLASAATPVVRLASIDELTDRDELTDHPAG